MSQTIKSLFESNEPTKIFSAGLTAAASASTAGVSILHFESKIDLDPVVGVDIDDLADEWSRDPQFADSLRRARARAAHVDTGEPRDMKQLRLLRGLSQVELARMLGTSQPHVARIEAGRACPTFETCRRLARVLRVDMNTLDRLLPSVHDLAGVAP